MPVIWPLSFTEPRHWRRRRASLTGCVTMNLPLCSTGLHPTVSLRTSVRTFGRSPIQTGAGQSAAPRSAERGSCRYVPSTSVGRVASLRHRLKDNAVLQNNKKKRNTENLERWKSKLTPDQVKANTRLHNRCTCIAHDLDLDLPSPCFTARTHPHSHSPTHTHTQGATKCIYR